MLFNSLEFALFLPAVFLLYWFVANRSLKWQNILIVAVSYLFYGWWDWRFLFLIALTTFCSYFSGLLIERYSGNRPRQRMVSAVNIVLNLTILGLFKYFNFFSENLGRLFKVFGMELDWVTLDILLPVGISFYTFQALSYSIDVYKGKIEPTHDMVSFFAFVSFFPQLVAGPIERATNLLPQFYVARKFNYGQAVDGMRQILWGLFKKIVVADNCAYVVNMIFARHEDLGGSTLLLGAILFAFQIYGDFSGYSDIAIGTARLFGFNLMRNFNMPYFSRDIAEFWRRWHISLTTWFRDYIYIPLGGSRGTKWRSLTNTIIIFLVSGLWHGANWTFILWGAFHALLFAPLLLMGKNRKFTSGVATGRILPSFKELVQMLSTFLLVTLGWIIFRAANLDEAFSYIGGIFSWSLFEAPDLWYMNWMILLYIAILVVTEWLQRDKQHALQITGLRYPVLRFGLYYCLVFLIVSYGGAQTSFIYFQF